MSILIKGIEMPKSCGKCEFNYNLEGGSYEWWECVILHDDTNLVDTRRTDCPLVEIPTPHGRIIDEYEIYEQPHCGECNDATLDAIHNAPTILEEEK